MEEKQFLNLLKKHRLGKATQQETELLNAYYDLFEGNHDGLTDITHADNLKGQVKHSIDQIIDGGNIRNINWARIIRRTGIAASIVLIIGAAGFLLYKSGDNQPLTEKFARYNVSPGKNKVLLTLANGQKISIDPKATGKLATQGGAFIMQNASGALTYNEANIDANAPVQYNDISVPSATQFEVILPDGSKAMLNAGSSLHYPTAFTANTRTVELKGEGYFEVTHNKLKPFIVKTADQQVEVLGTHFDVNAYDDEKLTKTTLLQGSVRVTAGNENILLQPGQQSRLGGFAEETQLDKTVVDTDRVVAWKNGFFQYHEADIKVIMRDFSRWYGVRVVYQGVIHERLFSGAIHRNLSLLQALDLLNYANVHFTVEDKQITISNN